MRRLLPLLALLYLLVGCSAAVAVPSFEPVAPAPDQSLTIPRPLALAVPAIGASSTLIETGLNPDGTVEVPDVHTPAQASWFDGSPEPGQPGPAVLLGHVDGGGEPGVFNRLDEVKPGDEITVERAGADPAVFVAVEVQKVPKAAFPTARVYGDTAGPELRLITCGGSFDHAAGSYRDQIIVYAQLRAS